MNRRRRSLVRKQHGFVLIALVALLVMGGLYFFISNLSPELIEARRQEKTSAALVQAREALIGYAIRHRESNPDTTTKVPKDMYGYLPLPDLGNTRNQNVSCTEEGCDAANFAGNALNVTVIGRFPWRTLGTGPLRDSDGECLWYAVSGSHQRIQQTSPMNWDTLSQLDVVVASGTSAMISAVTSAHERPIAVIFSPGPPLAGQDRSASGLDKVDECGGNYVVSNYLDPVVATSLGGITNYLAGTNSASSDTSATNKALSANSVVNRRTDGTLWAGNCPPNDTSPCSIVANDTGVAVTSDLLFRTLRGSSYFRTDINAMLERMVGCLRDQVAAGPGFTPLALGGFTAPVGFDKTVGRIPTSTCYDDTQNPLGYFSHYADLVFVAKPDTGSWTVTVDGVSQTSCSAALFFGSQRGASQSRTNATERGTPSNYLEGANLTGFTTTGTPSFAGPSLFSIVKANRTNQHDIDRCLVTGNWTVSAACHSVEQDIVRCIPAGKTYTAAIPDANNDGVADFTARTSYTASTRQLTLGSSQNTYGAVADTLSSCNWTTEAHEAGSGFRKYFRFRIRHVGEGFTFAVIDGDRNTSNACGAARQHLGYSGKSPYYPYIEAPKLAIEFDTARNCNSPTFDPTGRPACIFIEHDSTNTLTLRNGRNDPCYTSGCWTGSPMPLPHNGNDNSSHVAVVYWGYGSALSYPTQDDNVHDQLGLPIPTDPSLRPGPRNPAPVLPYLGPPAYPDPAPTPGIAPLDRLGVTDAAKREFHARVEVTRTFSDSTDPKNRTTNIQVQLWIEPHQATSIASITWSATNPYTGAAVPTLTITSPPPPTDGHGLIASDTTEVVKVIVKDAIPSILNGEYVIAYVDSRTFTAAAPLLTANPGKYISKITWSSNVATVTSPNHGLTTGDTVMIANAVPTEYNNTPTIPTWTITRIDADNYQFSLAKPNDPGDMSPGIAAAESLSPRANALTTTTRPMSVLDATFKPILSDSATIYDEQLASPSDCTATPCSASASCGSDKKCYRPSFRNLRLGFTQGERASSTGTARNQWIEFAPESDPVWLP